MQKTLLSYCNLKVFSDPVIQFIFKKNSIASSSGVVEYQISNTSNVSEVWDITNKYDVTNVINSNQSATLNFKATAGTLRKYLVVTPSDYYVPLRDANTRVNNQNIKGTIFNNAQGQFQDVDYIIISPNNFL